MRPTSSSLNRRARRALEYGLGIGMALPRTLAFAGDAWWRGRNGNGPPETPRLSPAFIAQVALDELVLAAMKTPGKFPKRADYESASRELLAAHALFCANGWDEDPGTYHVAPAAPDDIAFSHGLWMGARWHHVRFTSGFDPFVDDPARSRWVGFEPNATMHAWVRRQSHSAPWVVCVHPYGTGRSWISSFMFRANALAESLGVNVALVVLPLHGTRGHGVWSTTAFMTYNPVDFLLGLTQSVWDVRRFIAWIRQSGGGPVALYGVSLGAHVSATVAGLDTDLAGVVAGVPTCDLLDVFLRHVPARLRPRATEHKLISDETRALLRVTSPLTFPSLLPPDRLSIFAGTGDRMSPPEQAVALWKHWGEPEIRWFDANHTAFIWNAEINDFVRATLRRLLDLPAAA
ncbi:MAG TPA: alpha/beta hydrolase [Actinomycetota bacterium]|nr:alpha/beta hydrolase [Actinomycetota bacterium]